MVNKQRWPVVLAALVAVLGCSNPSPPANTTLSVVVAENFWGSIVSQLAGTAATVTSVVSDPNADPHGYEAGAADARAVATADYVVLNGAGYDPWATKLLAANPNGRRRVTVVADVLGKTVGDNPHFWYSPAYVTAVTDRVVADLKMLDPGRAAYFDSRRAAFDQAAAPYRQALAVIRARFSGTPVAATENIFGYLADSLGLHLVSPAAFMQAVAEGNDPPATSVGQFQDELTHHQVKMLVFNLQTATAVTANVRRLAARQAIPTVGITETIQPPTDTFQHWQAGQLDRLQVALTAGVNP